ncbi:MAG TPA: c-type cytochrome [Terracidiphilus sp.]|jgi:cytochrome c553
MKRVFLVVLASVALVGLPVTDSQRVLHTQRSSPGDLEVGGELANLPPGSTRFIRYEDLLRLPQETYTVSDDSNLPARTEVSGVALDTLAHVFGERPAGSLIVAICDDQYRANYPHDYIAAHHPLLVLRIHGQLHDRWPALEDGDTPRPYLISHPFFKPAFKVLSHEDEPQIPYGVTRIEFHSESAVFGAIRPRGNWPANSPVEQGYAIARQDCFRCHNMGAEGGTKAGRSWLQLAALAGQDGQRFRQTIRDPAVVNPAATMPAHSNYDDATLDALTAYFKTFDLAGRMR